MGRVIQPDMTLGQAYQLGYQQGFSKGREKGAADYRRMVNLLAEEKRLVAMLRTRVTL